MILQPSSEAMKIAAIQSGNTEGSFREALRVTLKKLKDKGDQTLPESQVRRGLTITSRMLCGRG